MAQSDPIHCELLVIGAGMAGMASALFAAQRDIPVAQVGIPGEMIYASGLFDVLGVHPVEKGRLWRNPWSAVAAVSRNLPDHPYARVPVEDIQQAFNDILSFLSTAGLPYRRYKNRNAEVITPAGTVKRTYAVPESMWPGVVAWQQKRPCLLIDFHGMKGFSARQIQSVLQDRWPELRAASVTFPELSGDLYPEHMAFSLQQPRIRKALAGGITPLLRDAGAVGFPAVLGRHRTAEVIADLTSTIGMPVFEVPTMPPAITGLRIKDAFERALPAIGVRTLYQRKVFRVQVNGKGHFVCDIGGGQPEGIVHAKAIILATGRFIGQGLAADRTRIRETVFGLPVSQPENRTRWHRTEFLDLRGHAANKAGLEIDDSFRPLISAGRPAYKHLYAAGSILAHADWIRMKCGSGLAIATARAAVNAYLKHQR